MRNASSTTFETAPRLRCAVSPLRTPPRAWATLDHAPRRKSALARMALFAAQRGAWAWQCRRAVERSRLHHPWTLRGGQSAGCGAGFGTWATTDHMIGIALGFPISRWVAARFGDYRALGPAYFLYAFLSLACGVSETIWFFVGSRVLLGLAGGVILPIGQSVLLNEYPEKLRTFGVGFWGILGMMPFMVGIFTGGWWA